MNGWPLERDPERVLDDVLKRYEIKERAAEVYGVVFDTYFIQLEYGRAC